MQPDFEWREGEVGPTFTQTLVNPDGSAPNFSTATSLSLVLRSLQSTTAIVPHAPVIAGIGPNTAQLTWGPDLTDTAAIAPGVYLGQWVAQFSGGREFIYPQEGYLWIEVEESLSETQISVGSRPSMQQVAGLLRSRTRDRGGKEQGVFIDGVTRPGATEVEGLIDDAVDEVLGKVVGIDSTAQPGSAYNAPGSAYERRVRSAVALYAAILIESSYQSEAAATRGGMNSTYLTLYQSRIKALIAEDKMGQPEGLGDVGGAGGGADSPADAAWSFPANNGGLVGWSTNW